VTSEELKVDSALRSALPAGTAQFTPVWGGTLYDKSELPFRTDLSDLPDGVRAAGSPPHPGQLLGPVPPPPQW
jgi:hypothetical protein